MKTYLSDKKNSNTVFVFIVWFLIIFLIIFYFFNSNISGLFSNFVSNKIYGQNINASDLQQIKNENERLKNENEELKILLRNAKLSEDLIDKGIVDIVDANILLSKSSLIYSNILINRGLSDGLRVGAIVFTGGLMPVGRVIEIFDNSSIVELFTKYNNKIEVIVGDASSTVNFIAYGDGSYGFYASVPYVLDIHIGDSIFLKENNTYMIGKVADLTENINNKTKDIYIRNDFNPIKVFKLYVEK